MIDFRPIFATWVDIMKFILTCIDFFSKYAWAIALRNKTSKDIVKALKIVSSEWKCKRLQSDCGREYLSRDVCELLKTNNMELWISENDDVKASIVEQLSRTLKTRMWKFFTAQNTYLYIAGLSCLVHAYNNTVHSSIKMRPADVTPNDEHDIRRRLYPREASKPKKYKFKLYSLVRISKTRRSFKKGYLPIWSEEVFTLKSRENKNRPVYEIEDFIGDPVKGKFYEEELQDVDTP